MIRFNAITLSVLILSASLAHAQTGPSGTPTPAPAPGPVVSQHLSPERVDNYLRGKGHTTKISRAANGAATVNALVNQDGWRFDVDIEFSADQKNFCITCKLGTVQSQPSAAQLLALMKRNYDMAMTLHFCYRESDRQLCLDFPCFTTTLSEAQLQLNMDLLLKVVRETHSLWDTSRWTNQVAGPVPTPAPTPAPSPTPAPTPPQPVKTDSLAKTTWIGSETLENYGKLGFGFTEDGRVLMFDVAGETEGTYTLQGNSVTLTFGGCVYTGTINGNTMSGMARQDGKAWSFSVSVTR